MLRIVSLLQSAPGDSVWVRRCTGKSGCLECVTVLVASTNLHPILGGGLTSAEKAATPRAKDWSREDMMWAEAAWNDRVAVCFIGEMGEGAVTFRTTNIRWLNASLYIHVGGNQHQKAISPEIGPGRPVVLRYLLGARDLPVSSASSVVGAGRLPARCPSFGASGVQRPACC